MIDALRREADRFPEDEVPDLVRRAAAQEGMSVRDFMHLALDEMEVKLGRDAAVCHRAPVQRVSMET